MIGPVCVSARKDNSKYRAVPKGLAPWKRTTKRTYRRQIRQDVSLMADGRLEWDDFDDSPNHTLSGWDVI